MLLTFRDACACRSLKTFIKIFRFISVTNNDARPSRPQLFKINKKGVIPVKMRLDQFAVVTENILNVQG